MRVFDKLALRCRSLFRRSQVESEMAAELAFHLDQLAAENVAAGMSPAEARRAALRSFGGQTQIEERCRDTRGLRLFDELSQDLRYAARTLRRSPVFTLVAALSLGLGIGANTAIFGLVHALLLRSLPVAEPDRLVAIGDPSRTGSLSEGGLRYDVLSYPLYRRLREESGGIFTGLAASGRAGRLLVGEAGSPAAPENASGRLVSGNFFSVLGIEAQRGRTFGPAEDGAPGASPVVVISHDWWIRRFAGDPGIVGRKLTLNRAPVTVIGVMPPGFSGEVVGRPADVWIPLTLQRQVNPGRSYLERWDVSWLLLLGRLEPGVSLQRAGATLRVLALQIVRSESGRAVRPELLPGPDERVEVSPGGAGFSPFRATFSQPLLTLMAIVGLVLLVACANVANLLLERAMGRQKEIAARLALGAGQGRLLRQLLTESLLLSGLGGGLGVLFALWAGPALLRLAGGTTAIGLDLRPDLPVLAFTALLALATGVLFGLAPARRATRVELAPVLKASARSIAGAGAGGRWPLGKLLVVAQFALSLLLLTGAGLFLRTLQNLQRLELGYDREKVVLLRLDPVAAGYPAQRAAATFPLQMLERLRALPGVTAATWSENGLFSGTDSGAQVRVEGFNTAGAAEESLAYDRVGPGYFEAVGIPLRAGRGIHLRDRPGTPRVAVINESMARHYFPGRSPIGQRLTLTGPPEVAYEIVGIAGNSRDHELRGEVPPRFYMAVLQFEEPASAYNFEIRTSTPAALLEPLRRTVREYDPDLPLLDLQTVGGLVDSSINHETLIARLSAIFGGLALLLAAIGLYGVVSYSIARRTHEIGIRLALGAGRRGVLTMVLRETLLLALAGIALGVPAALAATRLLASRLFGLSAFDPATLAAATAILLFVALVAGFIPGTRATRVAPTQALRYG